MIRAHELLLEGRDLKGKAAKSLERRLERNPEELETRTKLMGFYAKGAPTSQAARNKFKIQNLWFIARFPESSVCSIPILHLPPSSNRVFYKRARELWLTHSRGSKLSVEVLANAAQFFTGLDEPKTAEKLLKRAEALEPKSAQWKTRLGHLYKNGSTRGPAKQRTAQARAALRKLEEAWRLTRDRNFRFYTLPDLARTAFAAGDFGKAKKYATASISEAEVFKDWAHGNGIHHGHAVLGRIAFARGDLAGAAKHLRDAGRTPGSPQLNSFGPSFELAEELLLTGDQSSVLEYLELCRNFWSDRAKAIDAWQKQIRAGKRPDFRTAHGPL
jgi:tetratricopeptide (TPR) repeat protein